MTNEFERNTEVVLKSPIGVLTVVLTNRGLKEMTVDPSCEDEATKVLRVNGPFTEIHKSAIEFIEAYFDQTKNYFSHRLLDDKKNNCCDVSLQSSKSIARRKCLKKFGLSATDSAGFNQATTLIGDDVQMQLVTIKNNEAFQEQAYSSSTRLKHLLQYHLFLKAFNGKCTLEFSSYDDVEKYVSNTAKYVPPHIKGGSAKSLLPSFKEEKENQSIIYVTNLSKNIKEPDLEKIFKPFGPIKKIRLIKCKQTKQSKGFAFINYHDRKDAAEAIKSVYGLVCDHLPLNVAWAKCSNKLNNKKKFVADIKSPMNAEVCFARSSKTKGKDDFATIRVSNLSKATKHSDLQELFRPFGPINRIYLTKDKQTKESNGCAFVKYNHREDAAKAIRSVGGFIHDHLILKVEWAKSAGGCRT